MITTSIDIETTSLSPESGLPIQIGAVVFDTNSPEFKILGKYSKIIGWSELHGQPTALGMNAAIIKEMSELNHLHRKYVMDMMHFKMNSFQRDDITPQEAQDLRQEALAKLDQRAYEIYHKYVEPDKVTSDFVAFLERSGAYYTDENGKKHLNMCGKNITSFDLPYLKQTISDWAKLIRPHYRTLDPGTMYSLPTDEVLPNLELCMRRAKTIATHLPKYQQYKELFETTEVKHTGYEDAEYVAKLIWFYYKLEAPVWELLTHAIDVQGFQTSQT